MSAETARDHLGKWGRDSDILTFDASTATVPLAAKALGVEEARIAKTLSLEDGAHALIVVAAGDARLDNRKFKAYFGFRPHMLSAEEALARTGHPVGGVCPFGLPRDARVFLDDSLRRFRTVFPACGTANSAIELTPEELGAYSGSLGWIDVCKAGSEKP